MKLSTSLALPLIAAPAVAVAVLAAAAPAVAAVSLTVTPSTTAAGSSVQVSGSCEANTSGFAISSAFLHDATHDFAGVGAVPFSTSATGTFSVTASVPSSITPGRYSISARCGGGNIGVTADVTVTAPGSSVPTAANAGSGGLAATADHSAERGQLVLGAAGLALLAAGGLVLIRRRPIR